MARDGRLRAHVILTLAGQPVSMLGRDIGQMKRLPQKSSLRSDDRGTQIRSPVFVTQGLWRVRAMSLQHVGDPLFKSHVSAAATDGLIGCGQCVRERIHCKWI